MSNFLGYLYLSSHLCRSVFGLVVQITRLASKRVDFAMPFWTGSMVIICEQVYTVDVSGMRRGSTAPELRSIRLPECPVQNQLHKHLRTSGKDGGNG